MSRETRASRVRLWLACAAVMLASGFAAVSDEASNSQACSSLGVSSQLGGHPSKLDYLVLASMADSPRPLTLASYSPLPSAKPANAAKPDNAASASTASPETASSGGNIPQSSDN